MFKSLRALLSAVIVSMPTVTLAQSATEAVSIHGSLNAGYAKSSAVPVIGISKDGTADYRIATLQFRYKSSEHDQFVMQLLNRRVGTSPLKAAVGDVTAQWAYWQHSSGDFTFKLGRAPLPRGLLNEVRYIGTLQPFFRVPYEFTYDAFDAVDGIVMSYRKAISNSVYFELHPFFGGTENRNVRSEASGLSVRTSKANNFRGGQAYLIGPVGSKLGIYADRYERIDDATNAKGLRNHHAFSGEVDRTYFTIRAEHMRETGSGSLSDLRNSYVNLIAKPSERVHVALERSIGDQVIFITNFPNTLIPAVRSTGVALNYFTSPNAVIKLEHHWRRGYQFDAFVPPTRITAGAVEVLPSAYTNYWIASVAFSF